jgi:microcystin-dependent protein
MEIQEAGFNKELRRPLPVEEQKERSLIHGGNVGDFIAVKDGNLVVKDGDEVVLEIGKLDNNTYGISGSSANPVGAITMFAGSTAPTGWFICDGSTVSRTVYKDLFQVIGTTYGTGDGSTTFTLPNLKGKVPVGYDSADGSFDALGETGGAKTATIAQANLPNISTGAGTAHTHTQNAHGHRVQFAASAASGSLHIPDGASGTYKDAGQWVENTTATNQNESAHTHSLGGSGTALSIMNPYITLNYIVKY